MYKAKHVFIIIIILVLAIGALFQNCFPCEDRPIEMVCSRGTNGFVWNNFWNVVIYLFIYFALKASN